MKPTILSIPETAFPIVNDIAEQTWAVAYKDILSPEQIRYMLDQFYNFETLKARADKGNLFYLIYDNNQPLGFAEIELNAEAATTKLHKIYVSPEAQGRQLGLYLLEHIKSVAKQTGQQRIILNVNRYNKAKSFYEKQGFSVFKEEDIDIGNGYYMNDFVMQFIF